LDCGGSTPLLVSPAISQKKTVNSCASLKRRQAAALKSGVKPPR